MILFTALQILTQYKHSKNNGTEASVLRLFPKFSPPQPWQTSADISPNAARVLRFFHFSHPPKSTPSFATHLAHSVIMIPLNHPCPSVSFPLRGQLLNRFSKGMTTGMELANRMGFGSDDDDDVEGDVTQESENGKGDNASVAR